MDLFNSCSPSGPRELQRAIDILNHHQVLNMNQEFSWVFEAVTPVDPVFFWG